jgi:5-methylcytosine-specific restriction protein A
VKTFKPNWLPTTRLPKKEEPKREPGYDQSNQKVYRGKAWRELRALKATMNPLCELCDAKDVTRKMDIVHHLQPVKERPDLTYDISNLQSVCLPCHNRLHGRRNKTT